METNNIKKMKITKFLDVKTPQGILDKNESANNYSIGIDLYMPTFDDDFEREFIKANEKMYQEITTSKHEINKGDVLRTIVFFKYHSEKSPTQEKILMFVYTDTNVNTGEIVEQKYNILGKRVQIPTGIGVLIPENTFGEVRGKSSNFINNYQVITGTIDMNYTYSMGVQLVVIDESENVVLEKDQKIAQFVLIPAIPVNTIEFLEKEKFEKLDEVNSLRQIRTGGFGSTGKF